MVAKPANLPPESKTFSPGPWTIQTRRIVDRAYPAALDATGVTIAHFRAGLTPAQAAITKNNAALFSLSLRMLDAMRLLGTPPDANRDRGWDTIRPETIQQAAEIAREVLTALGELP